MSNEHNNPPVTCGNGCDCLAQCGDTYAHAGLPNPPETEKAATAPAVPQGWKLVQTPLEADGEVFIRFTDGSIGTGWATYWHGASNEFAQWTFPDPDEDRTVLEWTKNPATPAPAPAQEVATLSLSAEDVHAAFTKNFPKTRISQAWISFAADIAQAIATRAAKPAQEPSACGLCQGSGVLSPTQKCICQYGGKEPAQEVQSDPNGWCEYVAGMVFGWLQMQEGLGLTSYDEDRFVEAIAGIVQRRLWAYTPEQEVGLTDEAVNDAAKVLAERFDYPWEHMPEEGRKNMRVQARAGVEAALRAKGGK